MVWLTRLQIRFRLVLLLLFAVLALAGVGGFAAWTIDREADRSTAFIDTEFESLQLLGALRAHMGDARRHEKDVMLNLGDEVQTEHFQQRWTRSLQSTRQTLQQVQAIAHGPEAQTLQVVQQRLQAYEAGFGDVTGKLARGELHDPWAANAAMAPAAADIGAAEQALAQVSQAIAARAAQRRAALAQTAGQAPWVVLAATAAVAVVAAVLALAIVRSILRPIQALQRTARAWARGDLRHTVHATGRDEIAQVQQDLGRMHAALSGLLQQVRSGVEVVSDNTAEIAGANGELSERTERAAAALQRTAVSIEQLTLSVRRTADSATYASSAADAAQQVAHRGGVVVGQVVQTMQDIHGASRQIADIIAVIDSIAFQTNILALNAAVEAARAGEQGRGFAVVASEVRSLAGRSARAAQEIKAIIHASVDSIDRGATLVNQAGLTMREIVHGVGQVAQGMEAIRVAAQTQLEGIGAIHTAMGGIDQATQHNAAMVEESAAGALSLAQETQHLRAALQVFQLELAPQGLMQNKPFALTS